MSENKPVEINTDQLANIGGGSNFSCEDWVGVLGRLTEAYEGLVDFSAHVMERVANAVKY